MPQARRKRARKAAGVGTVQGAHGSTADHDIVVSDHGTRERAQHDKLKLVVVDQTMHGQVIATRVEVAAPTALHRMRDAELLGDGDEAERRFRAGEWLLNLYAKTHSSEGVGGYQVTGRETGEMSDVEAWNFRCWCETLRDAGAFRWALINLAMHDRAARSDYVCGALDWLADRRGL